MIATIPSAALCGVDAYRVDVEVDVALGLPQYIVVGLAAPAVKEGGSRIRAALRACGQDLPPRRVTVNLAPADRRKDGAAFDLPIALGVVGAAGGFDLAPLRGLMILGELGLDGGLRPVRGVLAAAAVAKEQGLRGVLVPAENAAEAACVEGLEVFTATHLGDVLRALLGETPFVPRDAGRAAPTQASLPRPIETSSDFAHVRGQTKARRAVEIAVAGGHNLLLYGPPGIGKTMIARRIPGILPAMTRAEAVEVTRIYSAAGLAPKDGLVAERPFRAPHHTASSPALVGGGTGPRPGEISLAHRGVLFLDELPEFQRLAIEALRQPLEERVVRIARAHGTVTLPAAFLLTASANPCPCGWYGADERQCTCSPLLVERYRSRLSGPLLDRIDLQVRVGVVALDRLRATDDEEGTGAIRARVEAARARQAERLACYDVRTNAEIDVAAARATCVLSAGAERVLAGLVKKRAWTSARSVDRMVRVARTIADLAGHDVVQGDDMLEAGMYRDFDLDGSGDTTTVPLLAPRSAGAASAVGAPGPTDPGECGNADRRPGTTDPSANVAPAGPDAPEAERAEAPRWPAEPGAAAIRHGM